MLLQSLTSYPVVGSPVYKHTDQIVVVDVSVELVCDEDVVKDVSDVDVKVIVVSESVVWDVDVSDVVVKLKLVSEEVVKDDVEDAVVE